MQTHNVALSNREVLEVSGVIGVVSFDDQEVSLDTSQDCLFIRGEDLHIIQLSLDEGIVIIKGTISSLEYKAVSRSMKGKGKNIVKRILK